MGREVTVTVHTIVEDGLPDRHDPALTGRVAFIFDGCIVSGWPVSAQDVWEADTDVGHNQPMSGVTHWVEFPVPVWDLEQ